MELIQSSFVVFEPALTIVVVVTINGGKQLAVKLDEAMENVIDTNSTCR